MFFAVIGDIKSNFSGLQALLDALRHEGIQRVLHTGNVCASPDGARECLALLRERAVVCVQGRQDKALVKSGRRKGSDVAESRNDQTRTLLGSTAIEYLHGLPRKRSLSEEGLRIVLCHGAVNSARETLSADTPVERFRREREIEPADIIVSGGATHPFAFNVDQTLFVSAGVMTDSDGRPRYTLVNTESHPWSATSITL